MSDEVRLTLTQRQAHINYEALEICMKIAKLYNVSLPAYWENGVEEVRQALRKELLRDE